MNFQLLSKVIEELSMLVTGARLERVYQGNSGGIFLLLSRGGRKFNLLLSPDRALPRMHLVNAKPPADKTTHGFILYLRSHITGGRILSIALVNEDRVAAISIAKEENKYSLIFELFGSAANLIFVDSSLKILSVFYPVPPGEQVARPLLPGLLYLPPENKLHGKKSGEDIFFQELKDGLPPNNAAEQYYERQVEEGRDRSLRTELRSFLKKTLARNDRLLTALSGDLRTAEQFEEYRKMGDLILANMDVIKSGMEQVSLTGYDGTTIAVPLHPYRSPAKNAELYFKKYKKAKAGRDIIMSRLSKVKEEQLYLQSLLIDLDHAKDHTDLAAIRAELVREGYLRAGKEKKEIARSEDASPVYRKIYFLEWEILVGKSAVGNDYITMKISRPDDLWLHAEGLPGSHVLVRNPRGADIPSEVLLKAASLAAYYSKGRESNKVSVTYTRAGLVRKPKGAKPGLVMLTERKSIMVKPQNF